ncbi:MAG TPA: HEAT repeat domain-containing protein, partial [bacterium]|nr:HEAT repeat domain-containing protein [bacterium]
RFRIKISGKETERKESAQHLLPHVISGKMDIELTEASRELLYLEITRNMEETGRVLQKQMKKEVAADSPLNPRDVLNEYCNRWVHLLGELLEMIHSGEDTASAERQRQVLEMMLPYLETIPEEHRCEEFNELMSKMHSSDLSNKIRMFAEYYDSVFQKVSDYSTFRHRVEHLLENIDELSRGNESPEMIASVVEQLVSIVPGTVNFPILYQKLLYRIFDTHYPELIHKILIVTFNAYLKQAEVDSDAIGILVIKACELCHEYKEYCQEIVGDFIQILSRTPSENQPQRLVPVPVEIITRKCGQCEHIKECRVLDLLSDAIGNLNLAEQLREPFIDLWQQVTHALLQTDFNAFRTRVTPLAETTLAPDRFDENGIQDMIAETWKSFAETSYFESLFKRLTSPDRETRFNTIDHIAKYGGFAVWLSLGGLNSDNWQLRRNLATIIGRVATLDKPAFLKQVLRDRDWHVRFEVISALRRRLEEVAGQIRNQPDHPLGRLITLALLDGRKEIREETYAIIETICPPEAARSLISTYHRLSAVSDDYEIQERVRILSILSQLTQKECPDRDAIIRFIIEVATMKEGLITPQWMIPLKKAAVESLVVIDTDESREWLDKLAHKRPHKRGIVGREARTALKKMKKTEPSS